MKIRILALKTTVITVVMMALTTNVIPPHTAYSQKPPQNGGLSNTSPKELVDEVWQIVNRNYVDSTFNGQDWQAIRSLYLSRSYSSQQDAHNAIRQMLGKLGDRFTRFMDPKEFKAMQVSSPEDNVGVGLQIGTNEKTKEVEVIKPIENTPAYKAGILSKDVLLKIDGQSTQGVSTINVAKLLRGKVGTPITLTIRRHNRELQFKIVREKVEVSPLQYQVQQTHKGIIGYIRLTQFSSTASEKMQKAIKDLESKQVAGYVLDLRSNSGGLLSSAVEIARMWINKGTIMSTRTRNGVERTQANGNTLTDKPLVVIINDGTASGAEILAGALQENNRAILIGTKTIGYNTIQSVRFLKDGSGLAVTVSKWRTPKERDINNLGISPDIVVNLTPSQQQTMIQNRSLGTMEDPQFSSSVEQLTQLIQKK
jgi:carboxyl-terminal processing protease